MFKKKKLNSNQSHKMLDCIVHWKLTTLCSIVLSNTLYNSRFVTCLCHIFLFVGSRLLSQVYNVIKYWRSPCLDDSTYLSCMFQQEWCSPRRVHHWPTCHAVTAGSFFFNKLFLSLGERAHSLNTHPRSVIVHASEPLIKYSVLAQSHFTWELWLQHVKEQLEL